MTVTVSRRGASVVSLTGMKISTACVNGLENWNAWVSFKNTSGAASATATSMDDLVCTNGTSITTFSGLCAFTCNFGYCTLGAYICTRMGKQVTKPKSLNIDRYPAAGLNDNYDGCVHSTATSVTAPTACARPSRRP
ncbi:hypothetical protein QBC46DRAFT_436376 [Diplogelasinospora grovesii]|uniref:Uncharacterized protein n=1 Tax=Diplogelasinospora grovesii TaxID=303347 RepID=A0AAN6MUT6_9PEZI|nr:hypothetical protein QBC46DRAFT_436376 [Diplogelasinospora grovesii]